MEFPAQHRYSIAFPMICSHFMNATHDLCPEEVCLSVWVGHTLNLSGEGVEQGREREDRPWSTGLRWESGSGTLAGSRGRAKGDQRCETPLKLKALLIFIQKRGWTLKIYMRKNCLRCTHASDDQLPLFSVERGCSVCPYFDLPLVWICSCLCLCLIANHNLCFEHFCYW